MFLKGVCVLLVNCGVVSSPPGRRIANTSVLDCSGQPSRPRSRPEVISTEHSG
jgi:hypothetical protein